jgi:hypothetical protein
MAAEFTALDKQKFSRFHLKAIVVSGIGFFTDALDIFVINLAIPYVLLGDRWSVLMGVTTLTFRLLQNNLG